MRRRSDTHRQVFLWLGLAFVLTYLALSILVAMAEGWSIMEGFYFGVMTLTTVGYGDLYPATAGGRLVVTILAPVGIALMFGIGLQLLHVRFQRLLERNKHMSVDPGLKDHFIVCGFGNIGRVVARTLRRMNKPVCVIERETSKEDDLREDGFDYVVGDAMDQRSLEAARVDRAQALVTTFDDDADNIYVVLEARDMRPDIKIMATTSSAATARKAVLAGAERVVSPQALAGEILAKSAMNPEMIDFMSEVSDPTGTEDSIAQVSVEEGSWIAGRTLEEISRDVPGLRVMIAKSRQKKLIAPGGGLRVEPGMVLLVVGPPESIEKLMSSACESS